MTDAIYFSVAFLLGTTGVLAIAAALYLASKSRHLDAHTMSMNIDRQLQAVRADAILKAMHTVNNPPPTPPPPPKRRPITPQQANNVVVLRKLDGDRKGDKGPRQR